MDMSKNVPHQNLWAVDHVLKTNNNYSKIKKNHSKGTCMTENFHKSVEGSDMTYTSKSFEVDQFDRSFHGPIEEGDMTDPFMYHLKGTDMKDPYM